ncbi:MAG: hypothetical protein COT71_01210 [Candidatus Andersenbacteria bacterium CG10_big_fil_rev_8_21_14_0_10_54_11]|uniref:Potassium channel domain-containing protein n=1 Tax=Candidatus Andersenbacteria bacterium CG10_big_fil_rev_8_21_14_0_10_54_11 TaxID=1974485 RepID=A0A2M6WZY8_9BACT|nr:MAG: hypothetical protein COT71_01210 [Candidatus Andersenbacteria bacterium CG10_big_fil_rev_8_21_14_0_10_54_11]
MHLLGCAYFSVVTATTLGYGYISSATRQLQVLAVLQVLFSISILVYWLGYIFAKHG